MKEPGSIFPDGPVVDLIFTNGAVMPEPGYDETQPRRDCQRNDGAILPGVKPTQRFSRLNSGPWRGYVCSCWRFQFG
jgi:hypothetical protein